MQMATAKGLLYHLIIEQIDLSKLVEVLNQNIVELYRTCSYHIKQTIQEFNNQSKNCSILNKYLSIYLISELSQRVFEIIENYLEFSIFFFTDSETRDQFTRFIVFNFDHLDLIIENSEYFSAYKRRYENVKKCLKQSSTIKIEQELGAIEIMLSQMIKPFTPVSIYSVMRKIDCRHGLYIEAMEEKEHKQFLLHKDEGRLIMTNANLVPNRWTFVEYIDNQEQIYEEYKSFQDLCTAGQLRSKLLQLSEDSNPNNNFDELQLMNLQTIGDIGSSLGQCLANINKYDSRKEFMKDFGQSVVMNGSITYIMMQMPLIGNLITVGGFGYFVFKIFKNPTANQKNKIYQFNKLLIATSANVGSGIGGAIIGQALLPIPVVGAIVGGFIGGIIGGTSTSYAVEYFNAKKSRLIVEKIEAKQVDGYWFDLDLLALFGMNNQYFFDKCPDSMQFEENREFIWLNMMIFTFLTVFYSQKEQIKRQQQLKKQEKNQGKQDSEDELMNSWPKSVDLSLKFLLKSKIQIIQALPVLTIIIQNIITNL